MLRIEQRSLTKALGSHNSQPAPAAIERMLCVLSWRSLLRDRPRLDARGTEYGQRRSLAGYLLAVFAHGVDYQPSAACCEAGYRYDGSLPDTCFEADHS